MDDRVAELEAELREARSALTTLALTVEQALARIQVLEPVVDAALAWHAITYTDYTPGSVSYKLVNALFDYSEAVRKRQ